jgi:hypothetical protein
MSPNKLFDYLDGKLPPAERAELERQLVTDKHLQRELVMAREIHSRAENTREVVLPAEMKTERGAILGRRVAIAFALLVFMNVLFGLYAIFFMQNRKLRAERASDQNRQQLTEALQKAAANVLPTPTLDNEEIRFSVPLKQQDATVEKILAAATQSGGSAARNLSNENGVLVFAEIPLARVDEFRAALAKLGAVLPAPANQSGASGNAILQIRVSENPK